MRIPEGARLPDGMLGWAIYWAARGTPVFPLAVRGKEPLIPRKNGGRGVDDATCDEAQIRQWWGKWPDANVGGRCDGFVVVDVDPVHGGRAQGLPPTDKIHLTGSGGWHRWHRLTAEQLVQVQGPGSMVKQAREIAPGVNVRLDTRGYVVLPGSVHPDGPTYQILSVGEATPLPTEWFAKLSETTRAPRSGKTGAEGAGTSARSLLSKLLESPPARGSGKANDWLTAVCGHYAKQYARAHDLYLIHARQAAAQLVPALDDAEKAIDSIWRTEQDKTAPEVKSVEVVGAGEGWLAGDGHQLLCPVRLKQGEAWVLVADQWADFDLEARGVVLDGEGRAQEWMVTLTRARDGEAIQTSVESVTLADVRKLASWCTGWRVTISPPERNQVGRGAIGGRLLKYLESQKPRQSRAVTKLGWDDAVRGFVTHDGVIRAGEVVSLEAAGVSPVAKLTRDAQYHYGFDGTREQALQVLAEVLTFQDESVASVFGAWWALCLVKGQLMRLLSQFPLMAIEATSESGKTTGFFDLMLQLSGSRHRPGMPTYPVIRDRVGAHRSGIVWVDDRDDLEVYHEVFRAASAEEVISKKAENRTDTVDFAMVAPVLVSGEALGIGEQKALVDRFLTLDLPGGIKQRRSVKEQPAGTPARLQWLDIQALRETYPDGTGGLSAVAGWIVQEALRNADAVSAQIRSLQTGSGRWGDTMTLVRLGGRLLDAMLSGVTGGATTHAVRCDAWVDAQTDPGEENSLTKLLLPAALRAHGHPAYPGFEPLGRGSVTTPAYIDKDGRVWYSTILLAEWWAKQRNGRVKTRTETADALAGQARRMGGDHGKAVKVRNAPGTMVQRYRWLPPLVSEAVLGRARGSNQGGGYHPEPAESMPLHLTTPTRTDVDEDRW